VQRLLALPLRQRPDSHFAVQPALATVENILNVAGFAYFARYDVEQQTGGKNFADNQKVDYAKKLSDEERAEHNVALSGEAAIDGLLQIIAGFQKAAPLVGDAESIKKLQALEYDDRPGQRSNNRL